MNDTEVANEALSAARIDDPATRTWNPQSFQVPRFFAFSIAGFLSKCLMYAALAALGTAALHSLFSGGK